MARLFSLFGTNDAIALGAILIASIAAGRLPDMFESEYPYPTTLYSILGTVAQTLAPLLAVVMLFLLYEVRGGGNRFRRELLKGAILMGCVTLLALALMPFSEPIYAAPGLRQGIIAGMILLALWSVGQTVFGMAARIMNDER